MGPSYINLFVGYIEHQFFNQYNAGLDVATCGVANATGFGPLATNFSLLVASLATAISSYYFILFSFSFPKFHDGMNEC